MTAFVFGWRGALGLLVVTLLVGQLLVEYDAFDARADRAAGRSEKPTVEGLVTEEATDRRRQPRHWRAQRC